MKIAVVGTGYVGLVTGTCFAETGNHVCCVDIDEYKVSQLRKSKITIYEPGLEALFERNIQQDRLTFTTSLEEGVKEARVIFLALPTPPNGDGSADLKYILQVANDLGPLLDDFTVIVNKSTVPVGTAEKVTAAIQQKASVPFDVVSNPEFLREGVAVDDFMKPDRVVIGTKSERAIKIMRILIRLRKNEKREQAKACPLLDSPKREKTSREVRTVCGLGSGTSNSQSQAALCRRRTYRIIPR